MNIFRKIIPLLLLSLLFMLVPDQASANTTNVYTTLKYDNPINHNYSRDDFVGADAMVIFGESTDHFTAEYLSFADSLIKNNGIQLNVLYYDLESANSEIASFITSNTFSSVYAFGGGKDEMWKILAGQGINNSVYLPIVFYVDSSGKLKDFHTGDVGQNKIIQAIQQHIGWSEQSNAATKAYKVLADNAGLDFEARRALIENELRKIDKNSSAKYTTTPSTKAPYRAGALSDSYLQNALRTLNLVRYLSGLPEVTLNKDYTSYAQHGAVLMAASSYGHYPAQPSDMSDAFYEVGYRGTSEGNIYYGYENLYKGIVHGWMADEDPSNIKELGHRRWALNPRMGATGLGEANPTRPLAAMYAIDQSATAPHFDAIAYPSGAAFPSEFFKGDYPWSVSLNPQIFQTPNANSVTVTLTGGGKTYTFNKSDNTFEGEFFHIDTGGYGVDNSIVFRPINIDKYIGTYKVHISGLSTVLGQSVTLSYETTFYDDTYVHKPDKPSTWAVEGVERASSLHLIPDALKGSYTTPITRAEFSQLAVRLYETIEGPITPTVHFTDTTNIDVRKMATLGIVGGIGDGKFSPNDKITREQAAKILDLLLVNVGYAELNDHVYYADQSSISAWAKGHVYSVTNHGIMGGVSDNKFDPKGHFTREQSILTMLRIWDLTQRS